MNRSTCTVILALAAATVGMSPGPSATRHAVPIRGGYATTFTLTPTPTPGVFRVLFDGIGHATHLGRSTTTGDTLVDMRVNPSTQMGPTSFAAANGDRVNAFYSGIASPPDANGVIHFSGTTTFTGGTGRFRGATGSAASRGTANTVTGTGEFTFAGTISWK